ncbi:hypothetical protein OH76DRAFT_1487908, partial [Lentinus brumalis]
PSLPPPPPRFTSGRFLDLADFDFDLLNTTLDLADAILDLANAILDLTDAILDLADAAHDFDTVYTIQLRPSLALLDFDSRRTHA